MKSVVNFFGTLSGRLTILYATLSGTVFLSLIVVLYLFVFYDLDSWSDDYLDFITNEIQHHLSQQGLDKVHDVLHEEGEEWDSTHVFIRVLDNSGALIDSSDLSSWTVVIDRIGGLIGTDPHKQFQTYYDPVRRLSVRVLQTPLEEGVVLQSGVPLPDYTQVQVRFAVAALICLLLVFSASWLIGRYVANRAVEGIHQVTGAAYLVAGGRFQARVPHGRHGLEINTLVDAFNNMVSHVNRLMDELRDVSSNIAHDLRSPVTRIRSAAEVSLREQQTVGNERQTLEYIVEECERLNQLITDILEIAAIDAGAEKLMHRQLDLKALVEEAADLYASLAEENNQQWFVETPESPCLILGDRGRLQRAVANLLDNAIKFTPANGHVSLRLGKQVGGYTVAVCNSCEGIATVDLPHIFDRFYRGDKSRSTIGNGLGLSYARAIALAHNGTLEVKQKDNLVCFYLSLSA